MKLEEAMPLNLPALSSPPLPAPPSFEECGVPADSARQVMIVSPLEVAMLLDWFEEDDD
ncbi:MAG: hypothetical protein P4M01_04630 [Acidobacteriota bacterium]|nr:hypothetical protein [Acidobacteriota bacterium]